jgi:hypothetical protein
VIDSTACHLAQPSSYPQTHAPFPGDDPRNDSAWEAAAVVADWTTVNAFCLNTLRTRFSGNVTLMRDRLFSSLNALEGTLFAAE